ncbi:MAG: hypothetical protein IKU13_05515 [Clostridia bacterium]|nr:hypothetical protein [Clostridia bacterium]
MMGIIGAVLGFILKTIGILLLVVLALILIILITPVKIGIVYPELSLWVSWNGIKYTILPSKPKEKKVKKEKKDKKPKKKPESAAADKPQQTEQSGKKPDKPKKKKESFVKKLTFEKIKKIISIVLSLSKKILKGIVFEQLYMVITVADEDKAKMAQDYGKLCILLIETQPVLEKVFTIKDQHVNVGMDFSKSETAIACDLIVYVRPGTLLLAAVAALIKILKEGIL